MRGNVGSSLSSSFHAQFKVTSKVLNGLGPGGLQHLVCRHQPSRVLRSAGEALPTMPSIKEARLMGASVRAFSVVAPLLFSSPLLEAHVAPARLVARRRVQMGLFKWPFMGSNFSGCFMNFCS